MSLYIVRGLPLHQLLQLVCGYEARVVGVEGGEGLLGLVPGGGRAHQRLAPREEHREVSLRAQQPDRTLGTLQVLPHLQIPETLTLTTSQGKTGYLRHSR